MAEFPGISFGQPDPPETKVQSAFIKMIPLCSLAEPDCEGLTPETSHCDAVLNIYLLWWVPDLPHALVQTCQIN